MKKLVSIEEIADMFEKEMRKSAEKFPNGLSDFPDIPEKKMGVPKHVTPKSIYPHGKMLDVPEKITKEWIEENIYG